MSYLGDKYFGLEVAAGKVSGYAKVNKFGYAPDVDAVATDLWDGADGSTSTDIWVAPKAARIHQITSTAAADDAGSTGAITVKVYGLATWDSAESSETITLNGVANVPTSSYVIIHRMVCMTWGTGGVNAGIITATADTDGTVTAAILAGNNQTQMCIYGIPSTQNMYMTYMLCAIVKGAGASADIDGEILYMRDPATNVVDGTAWTNKENFIVFEDAPPFSHRYDPPKTFDGPGIVKIQATGSTTNIQATGAFDAYLVDN